MEELILIDDWILIGLKHQLSSISDISWSEKVSELI